MHRSGPDFLVLAVWKVSPHKYCWCMQSTVASLDGLGCREYLHTNCSVSITWKTAKQSLVFLCTKYIFSNVSTHLIRFMYNWLFMRNNAVIGLKCNVKKTCGHFVSSCRYETGTWIWTINNSYVSRLSFLHFLKGEEGRWGGGNEREDSLVYSIKKNPNNLFLCSFFFHIK